MASLVNNVGKAGGTDIVSTTDAEWASALDQTLFPAIRLSREAVPHLRLAGAGVILMIASIWGRESGGRMTYNAVKAAEISLAKAMAQQLAKDNIRVNSVAPVRKSRGENTAMSAMVVAMTAVVISRVPSMAAVSGSLWSSSWWR